MNFQSLQQRALANPMANARDALGGQVRVGAVARVVVGNATAIDWLKKRLAAGELPGAPGANIPVGAEDEITSFFRRAGGGW